MTSHSAGSRVTPTSSAVNSSSARSGRWMVVDTVVGRVVADDEQRAAGADGGGEPAVQVAQLGGRQVHELRGHQVEPVDAGVPGRGRPRAPS